MNLNDEASTAIATSLRPGIPLGALLCIAESHMPLGELLCIVAVQADDLPSFQWLVESEKIPLSNNCRAAAVGMCVELGRAEVLLWMRSRGMLRALETKDGQQLQTDEKFSFVQDALKKGFTLVADILLSCEFPSHDSSGTSAASIAKQSETASVRTWGEEKERPLSLESDAERLMPPFGNMSDSHLVSGVKKHFGDALKTFASALSSLRKEQKPAWSPSDLVKNDGTLSDIQQEVKSGRISLITITHLAAVHDRKDVLQWLVEDRNMSLDARERRPASWYCWEGC